MLRTRARVAELATLWRNESKRPDMLLQPGRLLGAAEGLLANRRADLDDPFIEFVRASAAGRIRRRRLRRLAVAGVCVVAAVTSILALVAYRSALAAKRASELALARQLTTQSEQVLTGGNPELAALLAVESVRRAPQLENDVALRSASRLLLYPVHVWSMGNQVNSVSFSRDGRYLTTGSADKTARVFEAASGREVSRLLHDDVVDAVAFSPNGRYVVTGSADKTARVFEAASGREVSRLVHDDLVIAVAFSPDGRYVATGSWDNAAGCSRRRTDARSQRLVHGGPVNAVAFSPDGRMWLPQRRRHRAGLRGVERIAKICGSFMAVLSTPSRSAPTVRYVATGSYDETARLFAAASGREVSRLVHDGWCG